MKRLVGILLGLTFANFLAQIASAQSVRAHGLEFTTISNAVLVTNLGSALFVYQMHTGTTNSSLDDDSIAFGTAVHLGEAESGVYVYPAGVDEFLDGRAMWGFSYGSVNGVTNQLIGMVKGRRAAWGVYDVEVDFSAVGATNYTYQVWCHGTLNLYQTNRGSCSGVFTINVEDYNVRVNPFFSHEMGIGVIIEFPNRSQFAVEGGGSGVGNRFMIIAEGVTNHVDHLSRVEIFGSANLAAFAIEDARPGLFGRPHKALGDAQFSLQRGRLGVTNPGTDMSGVMVDFERARNWSVQTEPFGFQGTDGSITLSATAQISAPAQLYTYIGPVGLAKSTNGTAIFGAFPSLGATNVTLNVFRGTNLEGSFQGVADVPIATLAATNPLITGFSVRAGDATSSAAVGFSLLEPSLITASNGMTLEGDRFELLATSTIRAGWLRDAHLLVQGASAFAITGETMDNEPLLPLELRIDRAAPNGVAVSWPFHPCYYLAINDTALSPTGWWGYGYGSYRDFRFQYTTPITNSHRFFRLLHTYDYYIRDDWDND